MTTVVLSDNNSFAQSNYSDPPPLDSFIEEQSVEDFSFSSSFNQESPVDHHCNGSSFHGSMSSFPSSPSAQESVASFPEWTSPSSSSTSSMPATIYKKIRDVTNTVASASLSSSSTRHTNLAFGAPDFAPKDIDLPWLPAADGSMEDITTDQEMVVVPGSSKKLSFLSLLPRNSKNDGCVIFPWMCDSEIV